MNKHCLAAGFAVLLMSAACTTVETVVPAGSGILVGTIPATFTVSSSGAASYVMSLTAPPGVAGLTPQLAIAYSSQGTDSFMGPGFGVSGGSQIARCPSTIANDTVQYGVHFNSNDRFCLDGQLLVTDGIYGAVGALYRTQLDQMWQVQSIGGAPGVPSYWMVKTKTGLTMYYGRNQEARYTSNGNPDKVLIWLLDRTEDTLHNEINYEYYLPTSAEHYAGGYYLARVSYGGNPLQGTPNNLALSFDYDHASGFRPSGYLYGHPISWDRLLTRIRSSVDGKTGRVWTIAYRASGETPDQVQVPISIQECVDSTCLNPTTFTYAPPLSGNGVRRFGPFPIDMTTYPMTGTGQFDRDSKSDIIGFKVDSDGLASGYVWRGGQPNVTPYQWSTPGIAVGGRAVLGDFNGDGLTDIAYVATTGKGHGRRISVDLWCSDGMKYVYAGNVKGAAGDDVTPIDDALAADFDGYGREEIMIFSKPESIEPAERQAKIRGRKIKFAQQVQGQGLEPLIGPVQLYPVPTNALPMMRWQTAGVSGKASTDAIVTWYTRNQVDQPAGSCAFLNGEALAASCVPIPIAPHSDTGPVFDSYADVNNDGLADAINAQQVGSSFEIYYSLNAGIPDSLDQFQPWKHGTVKLPNTSRYVAIGADLNGDGYSDLALVETGTDIIHVVPALLTGKGLLQQEPIEIGPLRGVSKILTGDYNGDRLTELLFVAGGQGTSSIVTAGIGGVNHARVIDITNGLGLSTGITYKPLSDSSVYEDDGMMSIIDAAGGVAQVPVTYPSRYLNLPEYVISQTRIANPGRPDSIVDLSYRDGRLNQQGRGFLGFSDVLKRDEAKGISLSEKYVQNFPYTGLLTERVATTTASGLSLGSQSLSRFNDMVSPYHSHFPYAQERRAYSYKIHDGNAILDQHESVSDIVYDNHGDIVSQVETTGTGDKGEVHIRTTVNKYQDDEARWFLDRLTDTIVSESDGSMAAATTHEKSFKYDTLTGLLDQELMAPDDIAHWHQIVYERDVFGNIKAVAISGANVQSETRTNIYSPAPPYYGRFNTSACDLQSHCKDRSFDLATGNVVDETDYNGVLTHHIDDVFGRSTGTTTSGDGATRWSKIIRRYCIDMPASWCNKSSVPTADYGVEAFDSSGKDLITIYDAREQPVSKRTRQGDGP